MRVLIKLLATNSFKYDLVYHHKLQGLIYNFLKTSDYGKLHDKIGCKFFSFSNLIPPSKAISKGSLRNLIISSPDEDFIETIASRMNQLIGRDINIGKMAFKVVSVRPFEIKVPEDDFYEFVLTTGTPVVIRIPRYRWNEYGISPKQDYDYAYWRKEYTPTAFVKQLEENLIKRYGEYSGTKVESLAILEKLSFKKQVAIPLRMNGQDATAIGTLWNFSFQPLNGLKREILQFGLDAGLGEMNSLGFGFMNI